MGKFKESLLICGICNKMFDCEHEFVTEAFGQNLKVPHCIKCFFDNGLCPDKHGYQCGDCMKKFPEFNP
jgi:hypothetical protein